MAKTYRKRSHRKNKFNRTFKKGFRAVENTSKKGFKRVKYTSKKYMPQVKRGLESVGSNVTKTATKSVPVLQKATRDFLSMFGIKKSKKH